jgi:hypothetical protein
VPQAQQQQQHNNNIVSQSSSVSSSFLMSSSDLLELDELELDNLDLVELAAPIYRNYRHSCSASLRSGRFILWKVLRIFE